MAKDGDGAARAKRTLSERLMKALTGEVRVLELMLLRRSSPDPRVARRAADAGDGSAAAPQAPRSVR